MMGKKHKHSVAVEKAKRQGVQKYFYITGPAGWELAAALPRMDMVARLFTEVFSTQKIPLEFYEEQKGILYSYIEGVDDWVSENAELLLRAGLLGNAGANYINLYKNDIKQKRTMYLNTKLGLNAYYSFIKCDALSSLMTLGLRRDLISAATYKKQAEVIFSMMDQLRINIGDMKEFIWECRK